METWNILGIFGIFRESKRILTCGEREFQGLTRSYAGDEKAWEVVPTNLRLPSRKAVTSYRRKLAEYFLEVVGPLFKRGKP